jgi:FdrA protein
MKKIVIEKNRYVDSVTLMSVGTKLLALDGIEAADALMCTRANRESLRDMGYDIPGDAGPNDLVIAVSGDRNEHLEAAIKLAKDILDHKAGDEGEKVYHSLDEINLAEDEYNLVQISLPGEYAAAEGKKALKMGLDVFMFSDNVSLEDELDMKKLAEEKGLLMMGPDCGVALIDGVALGAGSIISDGEIGIVAASGSGAQEVGCIIEKLGYGVSEIIGTGGRDLYPEIGGIMMRQGIKRMEADGHTKVIVLVSKLANISVMDKVLTYADNVKKPVVAVFLGGDAGLFKGHKVTAAYSLEEAAVKAVELYKGEKVDFGFSEDEIKEIVSREISKYSKEQKYFRGLYCGGTFTEEAMTYFSKHNAGTEMYSNLDTKYAKKLKTRHKSTGHTILDLGAEDFTAEAPHPVFDPEIRLKRLRQELSDPEIAVILLDFIMGPGVHEDPVTHFAEICREVNSRRKGSITFIASICGSIKDPQDIRTAERLLEEAGVIVTKSNYQSTRLASAFIDALERRAN